MGKTYGYVRVSTEMQVTHLQIDALVRSGVAAADVYSDEGVSGSKVARSRPGFAALMRVVERGDTIAVYSLSRLGRSTVDVLETLRGLEAQGVAFRSVTESIDTSTPMGRMVLTILAAVAQMEREQTVERVRAGLASAKARGTHIGRPRVADGRKATLRRLVTAGESVASAAKLVGLSRATAYRVLAEGEPV